MAPQHFRMPAETGPLQQCVGHVVSEARIPGPGNEGCWPELAQTPAPTYAVLAPDDPPETGEVEHRAQKEGGPSRTDTQPGSVRQPQDDLKVSLCLRPGGRRDLESEQTRPPTAQETWGREMAQLCSETA